MDYSAELYLCSPLFCLFKQAIKPKKHTIYYIDLYGKSNSILIWFLIRVMGRERLISFLSIVFAKRGLVVRNVPHASAVPDYHRLNIMAHQRACELAGQWLLNTNSEDYVFPEGLLEETCQKSLIYKNLVDRLWHVVENIAVLKKNHTQIKLCLHHYYLPQGIIDQLVETNLQVQFIPNIGRFFLSPLAALTMLAQWSVTAIKGLIRGVPLKTFNPRIAVELAGPDSLRGLPTNANYMLNEGNEAGKFLFYVRGERTHLFKQTPTSDAHIVFLNHLAPRWQDVKELVFIYSRLFKQVVKGKVTVYDLLQRLKDVLLYIELTTLFRQYPSLKAHVYNIFVNAANITVRLDAGLVTGICRKFQVSSISYQTRVNYLTSYYFLYDAFDIYCTWGKGWQKLLEGQSFVDNFYQIGNIYCKKPLNDCVDKQVLKSVVLFNSDIETHYPQHHTLDYNITFIVISLEALAALPSRPEQVLLKAKNYQEAEILLSQPAIQQAQQQYQLPITLLKDDVHDIWAAIDNADAVLSIGFTTPGLCALGVGKKSIYVTPYQQDYNAVFHQHQPFIAYTAEGLQAALMSYASVDSQMMKDLDEYADGHAAKRLYDICLNVIGEG